MLSSRGTKRLAATPFVFSFSLGFTWLEFSDQFHDGYIILKVCFYFGI